ncbi:RNA polymerase sigma factor SigM [Nocardioides montaniterrae]
MRDDAELLAAHVAGDPEAFGELFARHRDRLWALALRTTGDAEVAADGLQDAMIAAFRRAASFRGDAQVTTWLHRVVVNACLDQLRRRASRRTDALPDDVDETDRRTLRTDEAADPAELNVRRERAAAVMTALQRLPAEQRAAVVLVDMEGYPVAEVAEMLDCAVGTVKSRCSRGRARLAVLLRDLLDVDEAAPVGEPHGNPSNPPDVGSGSPRGPPATPLVPD